MEGSPFSELKKVLENQGSPESDEFFRKAEALKIAQDLAEVSTTQRPKSTPKKFAPPKPVEKPKPTPPVSPPPTNWLREWEEQQNRTDELRGPMHGPDEPDSDSNLDSDR